MKKGFSKRATRADKPKVVPNTKKFPATEEQKTALAMGLMEKDFQRIVSSLRNLRGFCLDDDCPDKVLMHFPPKPEMPQLVEYIEEGRVKGIDQRAHCQHLNHKRGKVVAQSRNGQGWLLWE